MRRWQNVFDGERIGALLQLGVQVASGKSAKSKKYALAPNNPIIEHDLDVLHLIRWYVVGTTTMRPNIRSGLLTAIP